MKLNLFKLQLFAEGGAGASASAGEAGADGGTAEALNVSVANSQSGDLSNVVYGKPINEELAQPTVEDSTASTPEDRSKAFDDMIKKGGEYAEEFNKRTQDIINKRFRETKKLEETVASQTSIMQTLAGRYGVDPSDIKALQKAIDEDDSLIEQQAFKEGLSVEHYREKMALQRENQALKEAEQKRIDEEQSNQLLQKLMADANEFSTKYGLANFDLGTELANDDFTNLLRNGISFESAYMAVHHDEMMGAAMQRTASEVEKSVAQRVTARHQRPSENGIESSNSNVFKRDVSQFTDADFKEIEKRVLRGEIISL